MQENKKIEIIEGQLRQMFGHIVWSHKIQEKQADIYRKKHNYFETTRIIASSLISSGVVASIFIDSDSLKIITAIVSFITLCITSYLKSYDLGAMATEHKKSALAYLSLRNRFSSTLSDIKTGSLQFEDIKKVRDRYIDEIEVVNTNSRDASDEAVKQAGISLKLIQDNTFTDEEIDSYLPSYATKGGLSESE